MRKLSALFVSLFIFAMQLCADGSTYLNFTAVNGPAKVCLYREDSCAAIELQYSLDNCRTWSDYTINQDIQLSSGATAFFKANDFNSTFNSKVSVGSPNCHFRFEGMVAADGNIMSLLDASMTLTSVPQYAFQYLFYGCSTLTQAPALPATNLAEGCYYGMFHGCTSLTQAPALPAMNLAVRCYYGMFHGCTSLTQAPALPAMNLAKECYDGMFYGCTSLTQAPALPAMNLAEGCYSSMFRDCSSLTQAPALPAMNLAELCYSSMFRDCSSLTQAPALPAMNLAVWCYYDMFWGCISLTQAPALPAMNLAVQCYYGMFYGCTSLTQAPALPAMNLAEECYYGMFWGCTSLTQAPALPAMNLAVRCYYGMFYRCTSLIVNSNPPGKEWQIPSNATPAAGWNEYMFIYTGGTFTGDPEIGVTYYIASDPTTEMEYVDVADYIVFANDGRIFVTGAGEATVSIYDVNGRMVATSGDASEPHEFNVNAAGVYFVRIDDREPVKVVVR